MTCGDPPLKSIMISTRMRIDTPDTFWRSRSLSRSWLLSDAILPKSKGPVEGSSIHCAPEPDGWVLFQEDTLGSALAKVSTFKHSGLSFPVTTSLIPSMRRSKSADSRRDATQLFVNCSTDKRLRGGISRKVLYLFSRKSYHLANHNVHANQYKFTQEQAW